MGNFYTNFTARTPDRDAVIDTLRDMGRTAYIAPTSNGNTVVYDRECDDQSFDAIEKLGTELSSALNAPVLAILDHDDDILFYWLFESGQLIDDYNSCPSYFDEMADPSGPSGFDAVKLCAAFGCRQNVNRVAEILQKSSFDEDGYVFAMERHQDLAEALELPDWGVGTGYCSIEIGELPPALSKDDLTLIG
jgi:hypothetical protein